MNTKPSTRLLGYAVIVIGMIAVFVLLRHSCPEGTDTMPLPAQVPCPSADPYPNSATGNQAAAPVADVVLTNREPASLTGEAAKAELRKNGQYESLGAALAAARRAVEKIDPAGPHSRGAGYYANNPGQKLRAWFSNDGVELASGISTRDDEEPWSVALRLRGVGRGGSLTPVAPGTASGEGNRVEVKHHGTSITQWFENGKEALEQGFTLEEPPQGEAGEVTLLLELEGSLLAEAMAGQESIRLVDAAGDEVLHYTGLKAWDADGRVLAARMEVRGSASLALVVADAGARYPVTIDPLFANVTARLEEEYPDYDNFGSSVALTGDSALVGAPNDDTAGGKDAGSAYVFVRSGGTWSLQTKLTAADAAASDFFGRSVAITGDTALVGADCYGTFPARAGSVYVFVRNGALWSHQAKLTASGAMADDYFGRSVALAGDTALVGADGDDSAAGMATGSAYVFVRSGTLWNQQAKLTANDAAANDEFGFSVALAGDTALVGAPGNGTVPVADAGSAYVFVRSGALWSQQAKLTADDAEANDEFGFSVALSDDTALVGADKDDTTGSAYVFVRSGALWSQQAKLTGVGGPGDRFGCAVALAGDTALVGADCYDTFPVRTGSAYVFVRSGTAWSQQAKLGASGAVADDYFGRSVAIAGNTALVGADGDDSAAGRASGSAYVLVRVGTEWSRQVRLTSGEGLVDVFHFGYSVALSDNTALIGAYGEFTTAGYYAGSAYVFVRCGAGWRHEAKLTAGDAAAGDAFGFSVALAGDTALVGAPWSGAVPIASAGSAYVFVRAGVLWGQQAKLTASDPDASKYFGQSVALSADTALVGAPGNGTMPVTVAGSAYVFVRSGALWSQQAKLTDADAGASGTFGYAVTLAGDTALVGAYWALWDTAAAAGAYAGSAYVFVRSGTVWNQQAKLTANDPADFDRFGCAVALAGDTALVGADSDDTETVFGTNAGSAYVFVRSGTVWSQQAKLTAVGAVTSDTFGCAVALAGDTAIVGAARVDDFQDTYPGSAYVFVRGGALWSQQAKLTAGVDASGGDRFGVSVALAGDTVLVGAHESDTWAGVDAGNAYVFLLGEMPVITQHPLSQTVVPGQAVTFSVTAGGYAPLLYQWRKDGYLIDGATGTVLTIPSAQVAAQGNYDCVVSNIGGVATSAPAMLAVNALSEFVQDFPDPPPAAQGYLFVTLTPPGVGGWRFAGEQQWRASGVPVGGLTTSDRVIECMPVNGYNQPPPEPVSVISGGAPTLIALHYQNTGQSGSGGLCVILKPAALATSEPEAERAQWRLFKPGINYDPWLNSAEVLGGLVAGSYLVECKPVAGRSTPPPSIVRVDDGSSSLITITYFMKEEVPTGALPTVLPFETVTTGTTMPYAYCGQIRSDAGSSSGFVVKPRVVATAGHVVFDDGTLSAVTGLQWLFQRDSTFYEPKPRIPRGVYLLDDYAAMRAVPGVVPGEGTLESQNRDAAALYFLEDAGRGGFGGFLASDATDNEFLVSSALKMLVGYPVDSLAGFIPGRMHATAPMNASFTRVPAEDASGNPFRTYTTADIRGSGGVSGGPLCVQFEGGNYYPAAIYLGGSGQTVVRSIDSTVIELFNRAALSSIAGDNNTGGGITLSGSSSIPNSSNQGGIKVTIEPAAARNAGAIWWLLGSEADVHTSGQKALGLIADTYTLQLTEVSGFQVPAAQTVTIRAGKLLDITFTYAVIVPPPVITSANAVAVTRGQAFYYLIVASQSPQSYSLTGSLPAGLTFNAGNGLISGTPLQAGIFTITVRATNSGGSSDPMVLTITSLPAISNQAATVSLGQPLNYQIASSESEAGVSYTASGLPSGVSLNQNTGLITGSPLQPGVFTSPVTVSNGGVSASATFTLTVTATPLEIWRFAKFGTYSNTGNAADSADPDRDGQTNLSEYAAATNPNNAVDVFKVLTAQKTGAGFALTTAGKAGRTYTLQRRADLAAGTWITVPPTATVAADGLIVLTETPAPAGKAFYRIQVSAP